MTLTIELSEAEELRLAELASRSGRDPTSFVRGLIEKEITAATSLDLILAPLRARFEASGMTDEDLTDFVQEARREIRREAGAEGKRR